VVGRKLSVVVLREIEVLGVNILSLREIKIIEKPIIEPRIAANSGIKRATR